MSMNQAYLDGITDPARRGRVSLRFHKTRKLDIADAPYLWITKQGDKFVALIELHWERITIGSFASAEEASEKGRKVFHEYKRTKRVLGPVETDWRSK